jgi:N-methylhydantoinase A
MYRIGIDVGGTFTDLVAVDESGEVILAKAASTPSDPSVGVMDGLTRLALALGRDLGVLLRETGRIVHGTTVATNALLEQKGARVGLLTTEGHRDVLEMREGLKEDRYNLRMPPPEPLAPRARRIGVRERVRADGRVATPIDRRSLERAIAQLKRQRVEAVAVCYLHSYRNPRHEKVTGTALARELPEAYVSLSSEVLPRIKEYERVSTTVVNAYVSPVLSRYLMRLRARLQEAGYQGSVLIMQSHGGVASLDESVRLAAGSVLSGPAGGVAASRYGARLLGAANVISFDMGGTSTDISLIVNGESQIAANRGVGINRVSLPSLDIVSLGAGGGSIAWVDEGGILQVGPASAGADPGPACYGRGGVAATVTDANLVLGYLSPSNFLGGRTPLNIAAAGRAMNVVAERLGTSRLVAASGIHQVINTRMAEGIRLVSVRRGIDPRRFSLLAFGGAAGLHVTDVARRLGIQRVVLPRLAAVLSAWGMLATDLRCELVRTHIGDAHEVTAVALRRFFAHLEDEGKRRLAQAFQGPMRIHRSVDMRYGEQIFEISVSLDGLDLTSPGVMKEVVERFHRRHEELYTYSMRDRAVLFVNVRVGVVAELPELPKEPGLPIRRRPVAPRGHRRIYVSKWQEVPVFDLETLAAGQTIEGPAIIEAATTTVLLRRTDWAIVTPLGWLDIRLSSAGSTGPRAAARRL